MTEKITFGRPARSRATITVTLSEDGHTVKWSATTSENNIESNLEWCRKMARLRLNDIKEVLK